MKRYNKETNQFETYSFLEDKAEEDLIRKLEEKKIPFTYSRKGLIIEDDQVTIANQAITEIQQK